MVAPQRIILVTGANTGIGLETSYSLASASSENHVLLGARTAEKGEKAVKELQNRKILGTVSFLQVDVTSDDSIAAAANKIEADFGRLDVLVNNAGIALIQKPSRETLRATFETNVFGPMLLTQALAHLLQKSKDPRIINVTSELGSTTGRTDWTNPFSAVPGDEYRMSKSALNMLTTCQSWNFKDWENPAKVWSFCPGFVITDLTGADQRQTRRDMGAEEPSTSAQGILELVEGERDAEANSFVGKYGKQIPW
ncbi:NAD(P)-binding protein [Aaosphaeria arxii CBS 175.79]|uniref:NAD(P)-binding protein n=1 Tax=Aaosphaeria arxii CBS 175.79 TaxID=1450172 RepID=A0A6A5XFN2_9PLEO|nr:NAD(P)-binding protein [Aaosphaeria arxii CBS 175.79]KAF2011184.1 NAD(P)-binding protein [Aaosphaeria arxii CBS 175.79]